MSEKLITLDQERLHAERVKGFLDSLNDANDLIAAVLDGIDTRVTNLADSVDDLSIPTKVSELTNDSNYQTDTDVASAIANADKLARKKIDSLSDIDLTADDADEYIYMLPVTDSDGDTYYQQYMVIDGVAEAMGTTKIDLEGYLTEDDVATDAEVDEGIGEGLDFSTFSMPICVNKNLFRNGILINPINQRGKASYTGIGYGFDGWYAYDADTTVAKSNEGFVVTNSVNSLNAVVGQIIPTSDLIFGEYTLSALSTGGFNNIEVWSGSRKLFEPPSDKFFSKKIDIDSTWTHSQIRFNFYMKPGSKFVGAKLERGDRQTFVYKDIYGNLALTECPELSEELLRCCRHLKVYKLEDAGYFGIGIGLCYTEDYIHVIKTFDVPMSAKLRGKCVGSVSLWGSGTKKGVTIPDSLLLSTMSTRDVSLKFPVDKTLSSLDVGGSYIIDIDDRNTVIELSSELLPA